ncbi:MAG: hypothetical protein COA94_03155 [Rickettsiales bacterium]|nr:MAG: hypothetical protein COA94_03155 [Rickettsiales bacterium]
MTIMVTYTAKRRTFQLLNMPPSTRFQWNLGKSIFKMAIDNHIGRSLQTPGQLFSYPKDTINQNSKSVKQFK